MTMTDDTTAYDEAMAEAMADEPFDVTQTEEWSVLDRLAKKNMRRQQDLAENGLTLNDLQVAFARLNMLVELLMPEGTMERVAFETRFQVMLDEYLTDGERTLNMARLQGRAPKPRKQSGLIVPG